MGNLRPFEHAGEGFRGFDRGSSHEHRLALGVGLLDAGDDSVEFLAPCFEDLVVVVHADVRGVGWDR